MANRYVACWFSLAERSVLTVEDQDRDRENTKATQMRPQVLELNTKSGIHAEEESTFHVI